MTNDSDNHGSNGAGLKRELSDLVEEARAVLQQIQEQRANGCDDDELLTEAEVAKIFRLQPRMMKEWRAYRGLPFIKLSAKVVRFRRKDVREWVAQHRVNQKAPQ